MSKLRAIVLLTLVMGVAFGSTMAKDTAFLQTATTASQTAVFVPLLAHGGGLITAISVSNVLAAPEGILPVEGLSDTTGTIEFYFFRADGEVFFVETEQEFGPGETMTIFLDELLSDVEGAIPEETGVFAGYAWVVANFDAVQGVVASFFPDFGFAQSYNMEPTIGGVYFAGIPVVVP